MIKVNAHILNYLSSDANINVIATLEYFFNHGVMSFVSILNFICCRLLW